MTILKLIFGNFLNVKTQIDKASTLDSANDFLEVFYVAFKASLKEYRKSNAQYSTQIFQLERAISLPDSRQRFLLLFHAPIDNLSTINDLVRKDSNALSFLVSKVQAIIHEYESFIEYDIIKKIIAESLMFFPKNVFNALSAKQALYILLCNEFGEDSVKQRFTEFQKNVSSKLDTILENQTEHSRQLNRMNAFLEKQSLSDAEKILEKLLPIFQEDREKGVELLKQRRAEQAIVVFKELEIKARKNGLEGNKEFLALIKNNIAACYSQMSDLMNATKSYVEAMELDPTEANLYNSANAYAREKNKEKVNELADSILLINPISSKGFALKIANSTSLNQANKIWKSIPPEIQDGLEARFAIATMNLKEKKNKKALYHYRKALEQAPDNDEVKLNLAYLLCTNKVEQYHSIIKPILKSNERKNLEESLELYFEIWRKYKGTEVEKYKTEVLLNISTIQNLLGYTNKALESINLCLKVNPKDDYFKYHKVLYLMDSEKDEEAISIGQSIDSDNVPDILLILAQLLINREDKNESIRLTEEFIQKNPTSPKVKSAKHFIASIMILEGNLEAADSIISSWLNEKNQDIAFLILNARLEAKRNKNISLKDGLKEICKLMNKNSDVLDLHELSQALFLNNQWYDAIEIFELYINKAYPNILTSRLMECYLYTANWEKGLELCKIIKRKNGFLRHYVECEQFIYQRKREFETALKICSRLLKKFPEEKIYIFQYANLCLELGQKRKCKNVLLKLDVPNLIPEDVEVLLQIYVDELNEIKKALDIAYEYRRSLNDKESHKLYWKFILNFDNKVSAYTKLPKKVGKDSAVFLQIGKQEIQEFIFEDRASPNSPAGEISIKDSIFSSLKDKKVGDEFFLNGASTSVVKIQSKWQYAFFKTLSLFEFQWESENLFKIFRAGQQEIASFIQKQIKIPKEKPQWLDFIEKEYLEGKLPIGIIAKRLGKNPIEIYEYFSSNKEIGIKCNFPETDFNKKVQILNAIESLSICADIYGLLGLYKSGIKEEHLKEFGKIKASASTYQLVKDYLDKLKFESRGKSVSFFTQKNIKYYQEFSPEEKLKIFENWKKFLDWMESNCELLKISPDESVNDIVIETLGVSSSSTIILAKQHNCIFLSDEYVSRSYAEGEHQVKGIWSQVFIGWLCRKEKIDVLQYGKMASKLYLLNYSNIYIDIHFLLAASYESLEVFGELIRSLESSGKGLNDGVILLGVKFLLTLWWVNKDEEKNLIMTFWTLIALCKNYKSKDVNLLIYGLIVSPKRRGKIHPKLVVALTTWFKNQK